MAKERIIWMLLITVVLVMCGAGFMPRSQHDPLPEKQFWIKKTFAGANYDAVLIGDSRTYRGIDPVKFGEACGEITALNFGYSSAGFTDEFVDEGIAKLKDDGKKIVVMCITPNALTTEAAKNNHYHEQRNRKREEILESLYFSELMYYFRPVDPQFLVQEKYRDEKQEELAPDYYHQEYMQDGWVASWKKQNDLEHTLSSYTKSFNATDVNRELVMTLLQKISMLKKQGYRVFGVRPPVHRALLELENKYTSTVMDYFIGQFQSAGGIWLETDPVTDGTYDGSHLEKKAAQQFSKELGILVREHLSR